jgi:hypothetical protein
VQSSACAVGICRSLVHVKWQQCRQYAVSNFIFRIAVRSQQFFFLHRCLRFAHDQACAAPSMCGV